MPPKCSFISRIATVKAHGGGEERISLFGRQRNAGSASQSEVMKVAVGFSPRTDGKTEPRRVATPDSALGREINLSSVAPRRRAVSPPPRGLKPTATLTQSLRDCSKTEMRPRGSVGL